MEIMPRARELGVPFEGMPGSYNAITDVPGVEVGHVTLINGEAKQRVTGQGPVRTGVSTIFPRGRVAVDGVAAGSFILNGMGEMTGLHYVQEVGALHGPIVLTNSLSVGMAHQATLEWHVQHEKNTAALFAKTIPVVAETWDGRLNDVYGFHVKKEHVFDALDKARGGPVAEGNVGGGTGMVCYQLKGGIGTSSRRVVVGEENFTVGVLVQANHGSRKQLMVAGVPVGRKLDVPIPKDSDKPQGNSIIIVVATDAPVAPLHLNAVSKRATLGLACTGAIAEQSSGDIVVAFSTSQPVPPEDPRRIAASVLPFGALDPIFHGVIRATEEAIINALVAARTMAGIDGVVVESIPHDRLQAILQSYGR